MLSEPRRADLGLVLVTALWGLSFPAIRTAMTGGATPLLFVGVRTGLAAAILLPFVLGPLRGQLVGASAPRALLRAAAPLGLLLGASFVTQSLGMTTTSAANSGFITGTTVVMVPFLDRIFRKTPLNPVAFAAAGLALVGVMLAAGVSPSTALEANVGDLWTLVSAAGYGVYMVRLQEPLSRFPHVPFFAAQLAVASVTALALAPFVEVPRLALVPAVLAPLCFCVLFASLAAGLLQFRYQRRSTPVRAALIFAVEPVFAAVFARALIGEALPPNTLFGGMIIMAGVLLSELGPLLRVRAGAT